MRCQGKSGQHLGNHSVLTGSMSKQRAMSAVPDDFIEIFECLPAQIERSLGYHGPGRFVSFHLESGTGRIIWTDGSSGGMTEGSEHIFREEVGSLAGLYGIQLGDMQNSAQEVFL